MCVLCVCMSEKSNEFQKLCEIWCRLRLKNRRLICSRFIVTCICVVYKFIWIIEKRIRLKFKFKVKEKTKCYLTVSLASIEIVSHHWIRCVRRIDLFFIYFYWYFIQLKWFSVKYPQLLSPGGWMFPYAYIQSANIAWEILIQCFH